MNKKTVSEISAQFGYDFTGKSEELDKFLSDLRQIIEGKRNANLKCDIDRNWDTAFDTILEEFK